ncbi:MAG TPA: hypothetical protein VID27_07020 [Blastocatellia bacterium]|jgi:hypothetical protein
MNDQRNWLEKLGDKIPGYKGYVDKERRRDIDKMHREQMANRLRSLKTPLMEILKELSDTGRLFETGPVDTAIKKLDKIENRVRFASYGYAGFFDQVKIQEEQLDLIYQFDLALVEHIEKLESEVGEVKSQTGSASDLKKGISEVTAAIDAVDRTFDQRYNAINNFGQGQAPGRPLFS